jgi:hypothetical protein
MADYKGIKGFKVQYLSADPSNPIIGQTWYNSTSKDLKFTEFQAAAWATSGSLGTARYSRMIGGTQNDAVFAGGIVPAPAITEEYNGTSWSAGGAMNVIRRNNAGCGVTTAAVTFGGTTSPGGTPPIGPRSSVEEYDGSTWTNVNALPAVIRGHYGFGTQTAAVSASGNPGNPPTASITTSNEYDGTNWAAGGAMGQARSDGQACGILTAGLVVGGRSSAPPDTAYNNVEHYDGTSWTAGGGYPVAMNAVGVSGNQTAAIAFGGNTGGFQSAANLYDGTSWTATTALNTARGYVSGCGTQTLALAAGGGTTVGVGATEEFTSAGPATKTITVS